MNVQKPQEIKEYLQRQDVQERIHKNIQNALSNIKVTTSRAASLFGFSESQLREWEKKKLLKTDRPNQDGKEGHRQYTTNELSKLAIFQELFKNGGYSPGNIPPDFDDIWEHIKGEQLVHPTTQIVSEVSTNDVSEAQVSKTPIDQRVDDTEQEVFWRYFTSQVLRLSLMLICEDIPDTVAAMILPLELDAQIISDSAGLSQLHKALIGWRKLNGSFSTFIEANPFFEQPSDFRIEPLWAKEEENDPVDKTMIVIQRKTSLPSLSRPLVQTVRRLLEQVYIHKGEWQSAFEHGMRDYLYQATDFSSNPNQQDIVLKKLMEMVIHLGGVLTENPERSRWQFCCLLLPQDTTIPVQKRSLVIRAQSEHSPYKVGIDTVSTEAPGLSLRAYQSGNIIDRPDMSANDLIIAYQDQEQSIRSAIAVPIIREDGLSIAALYIASEEVQAFSLEDQRILRIVGTMIEELLLTYQARQQIAGKVSDLIEQPGIVDLSFKDFSTENDFISDLESLLTSFQETDKGTFTPEKEVSFIAVDINDQSKIATQYGDRIARNLSREVGKRLLGHLNLFAKLAGKRLYHLNVDRYLLFLDGMSLDDARQNAEQIRVALQGKYLIDVQRISSDRSKLPGNKLELSSITVRVGVTSYKYKKVKEVLGRYNATTAVAEFRALIMASLDEVLDIARREGGDKIVTWDRVKWGYIPWTPPSSE